MGSKSLGGKGLGEALRNAAKKTQGEGKALENGE
jgi:hypothetical protein